MIKYLGSKKKLLESIEASIPAAGYKTFVDVFSGTSRVGQHFKKLGYKVISNDMNEYAYTLAKCYIEGDLDYHKKKCLKEIDRLNKIKGKEGWFTQTYCKDSRFFMPKNGAKVDAIRNEIEKANYSEPMKSILLVSLMLAADKVDSTCGLQMAYLKKWAARAHKDLVMTLPDLVPRSPHGKGKAILGDAAVLGSRIGAVDIAYFDPPYNQHSYLSNYHIWETLVKWDQPEVYGVACKRTDCKTIKSKFNSKKTIFDSFKETMDGIDCKYIVISFNNEGYIDRDQFVEYLQEKGKVSVLENDYKRYVGAQIGIFNPSGEKVGKVKKTRNVEYIFCVEVE